MPVSEEEVKASQSSQLFSIVLASWAGLLIFQLLNLAIYLIQFNDQSWLLYAAQRILDGAQISGPQLVETNPPLILWFSTIPAFLAAHLHLDLYLMLRLLVFAMIGGSVAWGGRILRKASILTTPAYSFVSLGAVLSAEIFILTAFFGEREHLLVILIIPYILSAIYMERLKLPFAELCFLGIAAGLAICFKPQHILVLIALELFIAAWTRSLRRLLNPGLICAVLAILAYICVARLAAPLYFTVTMPLLRDTYWAWGEFSTLSLIKSQPLFDIFFLLALAAFILLRRRLRFAMAPGVFLICSLAAAIACIAQHTGSANRAYPQYPFLILAVCFIVLGFIPPSLSERWRFDSTFAIATLVFSLLLIPSAMIINRSEIELLAAHRPYFETVFSQYPSQTPVYLLSFDLEAFPAITQDHLTWASRFPYLWMLPAIVQNEMAEHGGPTPRKILPAETVARLAAEQRIETTEDFQRWKPTVVVVMQCHRNRLCVGLEDRDFDLLAWFLKSPAFAAEWKNYHFKSTQGGYDVYTRTQ